jgi:hypothetical protein
MPMESTAFFATSERVMMSRATTFPTQTAPHPTAPFWKELLAKRGLSENTITHFVITPRGEGWQYPIHPAIAAKRWKAFDSGTSPKYLWLPSKSDSVRFYDCDSSLHDEVAIAGGLLWLASGEADVWALWEGGIRNATCLFDGEARKMPPWLVPELTQLGVRELHLAPDRDQAGIRWVINISRALSRTSIRVIMHKLPFPPRSKGDVGRLLVEVGSAKLKPTLSTLPAFKATFVPSDTGHKPAFVQLRLPHLFPNRDGLYDQWAVEVVEEAAVRMWGISPPARRGFSKNFRCPFHEDRRPSAGWSYRTHGVHCFACGYHTTQEVAALLGVQSWEAFRVEHLMEQNAHR